MLSIDVKLNRARLARNYWLGVPEDRVAYRLGDWIRGPSRNREEKHLNAYGYEFLKCGTVACLAGVLMTMPEVQDDARYTRIENTLAARILHLTEWLGLETSISYLLSTCDLGDHESDKEVGLVRLDQYIATLEAALKETP